MRFFLRVRNISVASMLGFFTIVANAQEAKDRAILTSQYNFKAIEKQELALKENFQQAEKRVSTYLLKNKRIKRSYTINNVHYYIKDVRKDGTPIIINTKNLESGTVIKTDRLYNNGALGLNIQGQGLTAGVWDGGLVRTSHELLTGKTTQIDGATTLSDHATHVTGTFTGASIVARPDARGIAFSASAHTYFWDNDATEYAAFADAGNLVSNHSYGRQNTSEPIWSFGAYDGEARTLDNVLALRPNYLQCWAGGNEQQSNNNFTNKNGYDVMTGTSVSKNVITVGAVTNAGAMSDFSNWGPTDDGRIKPEICAKGVDVTSSYSGADNQYNTGQGTSYASPAVAGAALLLQQFYHSRFAQYMESAGVKGVLLHTATDLGVAGPDYKFGWGLVNAEAGVRAIGHANATFGTHNSETKIAKITSNPSVGSDVTYTVRARGGEKLMASISWVDDGGAEQVENDGIDPTAGRLVYNFDIKVIDLVTNAEFFPWSGPGMANRTQPSTRTGLNNVDNFKRVDIDAPVAGRDYQIVITKRTGSPATVRNYTIIVTGLENTTPTSTTWDGTSWSNGVPNFYTNAIIASNTAPASFTCNNLTINNDIVLTTTGITVNVHGNITNNGNGITGNGSVLINNATTISGNAINVASNIAVSNGTLNANNLLRITPNGSISGNYAGITGTTTLQASVIGQRGNRVFANPFTTTQTLSTVATNNGITINTTAGAAGITDARTFDPSLGATGQWTNLTSTVAANQAYALFIRGLASEVTGLSYSGGPTAFTYNVSGTLNGNSVTLPTNATAGRLSIVGNPYAAPVNTQALTGGTSLGYQVYQITAGANATERQTRRGSWVTVVASNNTTTIPTLGVLAFQASTADITVANTNINTSGTAATNLFNISTNNQLQYVDVAVQQNNQVVDNMIVRNGNNFTANGTDGYDLTKMGNDVVNIYSVTPDGKRLALDARNVEDKTNNKINVGIRSTTGNYQFVLNNYSLPENITATLIDKYTQTETVLKKNTSYPFSITTDASSQGEQRFEIVFNNNNVASIVGETPINNANSNKAFKAIIASTISNIKAINIYVENAVNNKAQVVVRDMQGRTVSSNYITNGNNSLAAPTSKGLYLVEINDGVNKVIEKIIR